MSFPSFEQLKAVHEKYPVDQADVRTMLARVPPSWALAAHSADGAYFRRGNLQAAITLGKYDDGELWLHISVCGRRGPDRFFLPDWEDLKRVKRDFIGRDVWAYQVLPGEREYVNQNPYVLHLFAKFDGRPALPDFTRGLGTL